MKPIPGYDRINAYRTMWLFVLFDLPVGSKTEQKKATKFRSELLNDGFDMLQFSVYIRHCASKEKADVHIRRVKEMFPKKGHVSILQITDKQYGNIMNLWGDYRNDRDLKNSPKQLEFF